MRRVFFTARFEKKLAIFQSRHPEVSAAIEAAVMAIAKDPRSAKLHTHPLNGVLADYLAAGLSRDYRIVFALEPGRVIFLDIGAHDDVYR
jgi:mRNA-degrading endonuclease YafQ of YafQ-DinJ toxin-antitoxin module